MTTLPENRLEKCPRCGAPFGEHAQFGFCSRCAATASLSAAETVQPSEDELAAVLPRTAASSGSRPRFGDYDLLEEIARGGMGVVYRARQRSLNRIVAIKMLLFAGLAAPDRLRRFQNEAAATAALEHANIVRLLDVGEHEGQPFIAMEFITGRDLAQLVRERPLASRQAAGYVAKIARAVEFAHQRGVLHRDLKSSNVLVDAFDEPRVTDFGLARNLADDSDLTVTGQTIGSPNFMPPEQASGDLRRMGPASDVYGLGAILYHLLTARAPFLAETFEATLAAVREREPVPPRQLNEKIPRDLETICLKCLEKDPAKRYATARELADELDRFLGDEPIRARPITRAEHAWRWCRRKPALATAYSFLLLLVLVILIGSPLAAVRINEARKRAEAKELEARRSEYAADMLLAQKHIAENNRGSAIQLLSRYMPDSKSTNTIPDLRGWEWHYLATANRDQSFATLNDHDTVVIDVDFSPDGRWIASCGLDASVRIWDAQSKTLVTRLSVSDGTDGEEVYTLAFSPNGKYLAAGCDLQEKVHFWEVPSWKKSFVLTNAHRITGIAFSSDERYFAAGSVGGSGSGLTLWELPTRTAIAQRPLAGVWVPWGLAFSPDSRFLAYDQSGSGHLARLGVETRQDLPSIPAHERNIQTVLFSEDGKFAATCQTLGKGGTILWSLPGWHELYRLTNEWLLAISSRHDCVVTTSGQKLHIWRVRTGELLSTQIGHTELPVAGAISSTQPIIATGSTDKTVRLWSLNPPAGRDLVLKLPTNEVPVPAFVHWQRLRMSSNGRFVVTVQTNGTFSLYSSAPLGLVRRYPWSVARILTVEPSSDGKIIAVGGFDGELILVDVASGNVFAKKQFSTNQVRALRFSPDGSLLAVAHQDPFMSNYWLEILKAPDLGLFRKLESTGGTIYAAAFTPENRYFLFGSYNSLAQLVDLESGSATTFRGHPGRVTSVAMTPDVELIATHAEVERELRVWNGRTGREIGSFRGTWENYYAVALSPDGSRLAAGGEGVDIWDLVTRRHIQTLRTTNESVQALTWTSDMTRLLSAGNEAIRIWPADTIVRPDTNVLASLLLMRETRDQTNLMQLLPSDWRQMLPAFGHAIASGDSDGFWRKVRGTARLWNGDLARAAEDNPAYIIPARDPRCMPQEIDLSQFYNRLLVPDGFGAVGVDLAELRPGLLTLGQTRFDVRGVVHIRGTSPGPSWLPREVKGILINQSCQKLHFSAGYDLGRTRRNPRRKLSPALRRRSGTRIADCLRARHAGLVGSPG